MKLHILALAATTTIAFSQGNLTPLAAPAPTMKTLDQIEARTPIPASPAVPIAGPHFIITQPGSYYLTGNVTVTSGNGILITAVSDVTLDLNGFTIRSTLTGGWSGDAISLYSSFARLTVRNGSLVSGSIIPISGASTLQGFDDGIYCHGQLSEAFISGVHIRGMVSYGMYLDTYGIVENCTASNNGRNGFYNFLGSVTNCTASNNGSAGILAGGCSVTNCTARNNGSYGIYNVQGSVTNCTASQNFSSGFYVSYGVAAHCSAYGNSTNPGTVDKEIEILGGQRDACMPAAE